MPRSVDGPKPVGCSAGCSAGSAWAGGNDLVLVALPRTSPGTFTTAKIGLPWWRHRGVRTGSVGLADEPLGAQTDVFGQRCHLHGPPKECRRYFHPWDSTARICPRALSIRVRWSPVFDRVQFLNGWVDSSAGGVRLTSVTKSTHVWAESEKTQNRPVQLLTGLTHHR